MSQTIKTRSQLLDIFADNTTAEISAQDIRDFLVSVMGVYGFIGATDNATPQAFVAATQAKLINYDEDGLSVGVTPDYLNGEIVIDNTGTYKVGGQISFKADVDNVKVTAYILVDGVKQNIGFSTTLGLIGDERSGSMGPRPIALNATQKLSIGIITDKNCNLTAEHIQLDTLRTG